MADYYTETSFILPLAEEQVEQSLQIISNYEKELDNKGECLTFEFEKEDGGIWFHGDCIDIDMLVDVVQSILDKLDIEDEIRFYWAEYCSKPRLNSFGGGACKLNANDTPVIIWASECL